MFKQTLSIILISSLVSAPALQAATALKADETSVYQAVKKEYLPGITITPPVQKPVEDGKPAKVDLNVRELTNNERKVLSFDLLAHNDTTKPNSFLQRSSWEDLELYKSANILKTINRTRTSFGEAALGSMLVTGATTKPESNQAFVRTLVENPELFNELDQALTEFAEGEKRFLAYYLPTDPAKEDYFKELYYDNRVMNWLGANNSPAALELGTRFMGSRHASIVASGSDLVVSLPATYGLVKTLQYIGQQPGAPRNDNPLGIFLFAFPLLSLYAHGKALYQGPIDPNILANFNPNDPATFAPMLPIMNDISFLSRVMLTISPYLLGGVAALQCIPWYFTSKNAYTQLRKQVDSTHYLQAQLMGCGAAVRAMTRIEQLAHKHRALVDAIPELNAIANLSKQGDKVAQLINLLKTNTFKGKASYFSYLGRVLVAHRLMNDNAKALRAAFESVGKLDAFMSAAKLYKEHQNTKVKYCFAMFVKDVEKPQLKLVNFWNPLVDPSVAVPNSVEFGMPGKHRNMILTGLNSAGKSTIIKGIASAVLLAQVFGIVPAEEAVLTPFTLINTHVTIKDDIENHRSLFQVEVDQAKDMLERVRSLSPDQFSLVIIDEMFRSTGPDHAQVHSYNYAKALAGFPNVITLESTHYKKLIELEKETKGDFKNFKIEIIQRPDGTLYRPYKIEEGFTTSEITAAIFAEQGLHF